MNITKSQLNYLMAINHLEGEKVSQRKICSYLGVKGSSASIALKKLCETGYVEKAEYDFGCEYKLTENSRKIINLIEKERLEFFSLFCKKLSISYELCEKEYNKICGMFGEEFIEKLAEIRKNDCGSVTEGTEPDSLFRLEKGAYELPFKVIHEDDGSPSMGNKGFIHPARLIIDGKNDRVLLKAKEIYYKSKKSQVLKGKLSELYYAGFEGEWVKAKVESDSIWVIPTEKMHYKKDRLNKPVFAVIKIKAAATNKNMPKSAAEITFNLEGLKAMPQA